MRAYSPIDVSSSAFWSLPSTEREATYAELRSAHPVSWHRPAEGGLMPNFGGIPSDAGDGFWAVATHTDIQFVSRHPEIYCSGQGVMLEDVPVELLESASSFLAVDAPRHTKLRRLVSAAFTPKNVARIEAQIARQAEVIVDDLIAARRSGETIDFVAQVSGRLPMFTICEMMGVDPAEHAGVAQAANGMVGWNDPAVQRGRDPFTTLFESLLALQATARALVELRRTQPTDDLMTALVQAKVDDERLTDDDIAAFFVLLAVAGNDTTRHTTSHVMKALCDHPEQRTWLQHDFDANIGSAIEEFIRWSSPVMTFRRTATVDTELGGQQIRAGEKVVLFYHSGNRDELVFTQPTRFDLARTPNAHVGFGGGGPHFCMGAGLAKTQLRSIFGQLLTRITDFSVEAPQEMAGNFVRGITAMPCSFSVPS